MSAGGVGSGGAGGRVAVVGTDAADLVARRDAVLDALLAAKAEIGLA